MNPKKLKNNIDWALYYRQLGWSIFPVGKDKKPLVEWKKYQKETASEEQIKKWWTQFPKAGIGVVTGRVSGIFVLDLDKGSDLSDLELPPTVVTKTGGGGEHHYYEYPKNKIVKNSAGQIRNKIDIRGDGGYVLVPPSIHISGNFYEWAEGCLPDKTKIVKMPNWLEEEFESEKQSPKDWEGLLEGVQKGSRNETATSITGKLLQIFPEKQWSFCWQLTRAWNKSNIPPLIESELKAVFNSIAKKELLNRQKQNENNGKIIKSIKPLSIEEIYKIEFGKEEWLIESILAIESLLVLSGEPANFKTWVLLHLAYCIATENKLFGHFKVKQGAVLIIDEENQLRHVKDRLQQLGIKENDPIFYMCQQGIKIDKDDYLNEILKIVKEKEIKLVIFDSFVRIHTQEENDSGGVARVRESFQKIINAGASVMFTHHHSKPSENRKNLGQKLRGSSDILASVDSHLSVEKDRDEKTLTFHQVKMRQSESLKPFSVVIKKEHYEVRNEPKTKITGFEYEGESSLFKNKEEIAEEEIIKILKDETIFSRTNFLEKLEKVIGRNMIDFVLKKKIKNEEIEIVPKSELPAGKKKGNYYRLPKDLSSLFSSPNKGGLEGKK